MIYTRLLFLLIAAALPVCSIAADIAIIVHKDNPVDKLTAKEVQQIFLAKSMVFPSGERVTPISIRYETSLHERYLEKVVNKNQSQYQVYWTRMVFTGKSQPPKTYASQEEIIKRVTSDPTAIGFVELNKADDSVKIVLEIE